ncbi:AAA family ATPase [Sagittula sp. SSi028]|uniref:AAA family ATPase n=1 Tax=Sagittula sp. SSi028 TaxID=3400636 RepID=UPI003AF4D240
MHGRKSERGTLKRKLISGQNIHMPAPRRIGKTWTINRLAEDMRKEDWLIVEVDVQGMSAPEKFARRLCQRIQGQLSKASGLHAALKSRLDALIEGNWGDNPINAIGKVDPVAFLDLLLDALEKDGRQSAIFVDEIAYFVLGFAERNNDDAKDFFYELRNLQANYSKVRWLFTGSIGLNVVAERFGLGGAFVDLDTFILEPFNEIEARSFLRDPATQNAFNHPFVSSDEDLDVLFEELGWLAPYYLKLVGNEVRPSGAARDGTLTATRDDLQAAMQKLLEPTRKSEFAVWREHIDKNLPKTDRILARKVLGHLSASTDGEVASTLQSAMVPETQRAVRDILDILQSDGLVQCAEDRYRFRSGLIRRYWQQYEADRQ